MGARLGKMNPAGAESRRPLTLAAGRPVVLENASMSRVMVALPLRLPRKGGGDGRRGGRRRDPCGSTAVADRVVLDIGAS